MFLNIEWLKSLNVVKTKLLSGIQRNVLRICLQQSETYIKKLFEAPSVCNIPCKISSCICVLMRSQRKDWVLSEYLWFSDLLFCDFLLP